MILSTLKGLEDGTITRTPQGESKTSYAKMLTKEMGHIDWTKDAASIERLVRGLNPWPSAYTSYAGKTMKIWAADVADLPGERTPGKIHVTKNQLFVETGEKSFSLRERSGWIRLPSCAASRWKTEVSANKACGRITLQRSGRKVTVKSTRERQKRHRKERCLCTECMVTVMDTGLTRRSSLY